MKEIVRKQEGQGLEWVVGPMWELGRSVGPRPENRQCSSASPAERTKLVFLVARSNSAQ